MAGQVTDTVAKDFDSILESLITFASVEYGERTQANRVWSDFNISSFSRNWAELVAYVGDQLMFYLDNQSNQAYLETATIPAFIARIAQQSGYNIPTQQASSGKVQFTTSGPFTIPEGTVVTGNGIPFFTIRQIQGSTAGESEVDVIQGNRFNESFDSEGLQNEQFILNNLDIVIDLNNSNPDLRSPILRVNGNDYKIVTTPVDSSSVDKIATRSLLPDGRTVLTMGDGVFGRRLTPNESVEIIYRTGGGSQGNVEAGIIDTIQTSISGVTSVTNADRLSGGVDELTITEIKGRIPLSLKTISGAVDLVSYGNILEANFSQVLNARSTINNTESGIDIDIFVLPQATTVTPVTDNKVLFDTLTDFIETKKTVGTKFLIKDGEEILVQIDIEAFLNRDSSRGSVESNIREQIKAYFDLRTGGSIGNGIEFAQTTRLGDIFDIIRKIPEISSFKVNKFTVSPRISEVVASINQNFFKSEVEVFPSVGENEWAVITSEVANPEPLDGQVEYSVFKRTLLTATSLTESSIQDSNLDLTLRDGTAIVINNSTVTDTGNVFNLGEYDSEILVDSNNNMWKISSTNSNSIDVLSPALNNAAITAVANGAYKVVRSFLGEKLAINGITFTIIYNNKNTFFSPGASFNIIATNKTEFFISEEQAVKGTYGVPVGITGVNASGATPGDLASITFNGNPKLQSVTTDSVLIDRVGEVFEVTQITDDETSVASYFSDANLDTDVTLTDTGTSQYFGMPFFAEAEIVSSFLTVSLKSERLSNPAGGLLVDLKADDGSGKPGTLIATSNLLLSSNIPSGAGFNNVDFTFATPVSLTKDTKYHLVVYGDNAYKISYAALDGSIKVGIDSTTKGYFPSLTAQGNIEVTNNSTVNVAAKANGSITVIDNNIRERIQATNDITIVSNDWTGSNIITIAGVTFEEGNNWNSGASITLSRDALLTAITTQLSGVVAGVSDSTDRIILTADAGSNPGEIGNNLTIEVSESSPTNYSIRSANFGGGTDGDKLVINAPKFLNSGLVSYAYNSFDGVVTFGAAVTLPLFEAGMLFTDGAGTEHEVLAVNDGANTVTLNTGASVDASVPSETSGSLKGDHEFEFGVNVAVGATVDLTAANLQVVTDSIASITTTVTTNKVDLEYDTKGEYGNTVTMSQTDIGTTNFDLSGDTLIGGQESDVITVGSDTYSAVSGTPASTSEFELGVNANTTANNLADQINTVGNAIATVNGDKVIITATTSGANGNSVVLDIKEKTTGSFIKSGSTLEGGKDNARVLNSSDNTTFTDYTIDSELLFKVVLSNDVLVIVSKSNSSGSQILPQLSLNNDIDSCIGKRYYDDKGEVSFLIATLTPNAFIVGAADADLYGRGTVSGNSGVQVDQFIFRTSSYRGDVENLRDMEVPVVTDESLKINLLGGVS